MTDPLGLDRVGVFLDGWPYPAAIVGGLAIVLRVRPRLTRDVADAGARLGVDALAFLDSDR